MSKAEIMELTEKEHIKLRLIQHFHPRSMNSGGWSIYIKPEEVEVINEELYYILKVSTKTTFQAKVELIKGIEFKDEHSVLMFEYERNLYMEEADRYYNGMKGLIDG